MIWKQWRRAKCGLRTRTNGISTVPLRANPSVAPPGDWPTARLWSAHFPLLTLIRSGFHGCLMGFGLTELNRTDADPHVLVVWQGASGRPLPLRRSLNLLDGFGGAIRRSA